MRRVAMVGKEATQWSALMSTPRQGSERISNPHALIIARGMSEVPLLSPSELPLSIAARFEAGSPRGMRGGPAGPGDGSPDKVMASRGAKALALGESSVFLVPTDGASY